MQPPVEIRDRSEYKRRMNELLKIDPRRTVVVTVAGVASNGLTFTVTPANQAPTLTQPANQSGVEGAAVSVFVPGAPTPSSAWGSWSTSSIPSPSCANSGAC